MTVLATSAGDILDYALSAFFIASGAGLLYLFIRMGGTFARLSAFIKGSERDLLPVIVKAGGTGKPAWVIAAYQIAAQSPFP